MVKEQLVGGEHGVLFRRASMGGGGIFSGKKGNEVLGRFEGGGSNFPREKGEERKTHCCGEGIGIWGGNVRGSEGEKRM